MLKKINRNESDRQHKMNIRKKATDAVQEFVQENIIEKEEVHLAKDIVRNYICLIEAFRLPKDDINNIEIKKNISTRYCLPLETILRKNWLF